MDASRPREPAGLSWDPAEALAVLRRADPRLGPLFDAVGPLGLQPTPLKSPFEALARSIVYQQLSGKAAATILGRVIALYPGRRFPSPSAVLDTADEALRRAGLSGSKTRAFKDLAEKTLDGTVPPLRAVGAMSDLELIDRLTVVRGVGPWTVQMMLIFRLGRPDVLPIDDYGVRKGFARAYRKRRLPTPRELAAHGERWRPFRTVPSWYFWRALELPRWPP